MKDLVFLYPIDEYFDREFGIQFKDYPLRSKINIGYYAYVLNHVIEKRYREKGFRVNYVVFDDRDISRIIEVKEQDRILKVGMDFWKELENISYPDPEPILRLLNPELVVCGFHLMDCVDRFAEAAFNEGRKIIVDEDLTEMLKFRLGKIKIDEYPSFVELGRFSEMREIHKRTRPWWV